MAATALSIGPVHTLTQNVSYALPAVKVIVRASAAIETSLDESTWVAATLTLGMVEVGAPFIRSTAVGTLVSLRRS